MGYAAEYLTCGTFAAIPMDFSLLMFMRILHHFISFAHQHVSLSIDSSSSPFLHQRQDDARRKLHLHDREKYSLRVLKPRRVDAASAVPVRLADDAETPGHFALNLCAISLVQSFDPR